MKLEISNNIKVTVRYGLNTGQIVEIIEEGETTQEIMEGIQWVMDNEKFIETPKTMIRCDAIISVEILDN